MSFTLRMSPELQELLERQDGVTTRRQLAAGGFNSNATGRRLGSRQWQELLPGIVLVTSGAPTRRQRLVAAWLYGGDDAAVDGIDACVWHGVVPPRRAEEPVHLVVPWGASARSRDFVVVRRSIGEIPVGAVGLVPYVEAATALVVAARNERSSRDAISLLSRGLQQGQVTLEQLRDARERIGDKWCGTVDAALLAVGVGLRSPAEKDNHDLILTSRVLPEPRWNQWLDLGDGESPVCADALFEDAGMVDEVNGRRYHAWAERFESTEERRARLVAAGLAATGCTPTQLRHQPQRVLERKERTYLRHAGRGMPPGVRLIDPPGLRPQVA